MPRPQERAECVCVCVRACVRACVRVCVGGGGGGAGLLHQKQESVTDLQLQRIQILELPNQEMSKQRMNVMFKDIKVESKISKP